MTSTASDEELALAQQALQALPLCVEGCTCPDRWHVLWSGLKATGQARTLHAQLALLRSILPRMLNPAHKFQQATNFHQLAPQGIE